DLGSNLPEDSRLIETQEEATLLRAIERELPSSQFEEIIQTPGPFMKGAQQGQGPLMVTFRLKDGLTKPRGSALQPGLVSCLRRTIATSVLLRSIERKFCRGFQQINCVSRTCFRECQTNEPISGPSNDLTCLLVRLNPTRSDACETLRRQEQCFFKERCGQHAILQGIKSDSSGLFQHGEFTLDQLRQSGQC